jgi:photosystem II stability/assembly factor-like uncharacterized protein
VKDNRAKDVIEIMRAYDDAEKALRKVGTLLRTTDAGCYWWAKRHKQMVSGLSAVLLTLRLDVPFYEGE